LAGASGLGWLRGGKVVEVRLTGLRKGVSVGAVWNRKRQGALYIAMGDDRTDEDLFRALPEGSVAIHVGPRESDAVICLPDVATARAFLRDLATELPER